MFQVMMESQIREKYLTCRQAVQWGHIRGRTWHCIHPANSCLQTDRDRCSSLPPSSAVTLVESSPTHTYTHMCTQMDVSLKGLRFTPVSTSVGGTQLLTNCLISSLLHQNSPEPITETCHRGRQRRGKMCLSHTLPWNYLVSNVAAFSYCLHEGKDERSKRHWELFWPEKSLATDGLPPFPPPYCVVFPTPAHFFQTSGSSRRSVCGPDTHMHTLSRTKGC